MPILFEKAAVLAEVDKLIDVIDLTTPDSILDTINDLDEMVECLDTEEDALITLLKAVSNYAKDSIKNKYIGLENLLPSTAVKTRLLRDYTGKLDNTQATLPPKVEYGSVYTPTSGVIIRSTCDMYLDFTDRKKGKSGRMYPSLGAYMTRGWDKNEPSIQVSIAGNIVSNDGTIPEYWDNDKDGICYLPLSDQGRARYTGSVFNYDGLDCALIKATRTGNLLSAR